MSTFNEFDPLKAKQSSDTEVAINAIKREIKNILDSYVGWYDPFCEIIQNSLDSLDEKARISDSEYIPTIRVIINNKENLGLAY